MAFRLQFVKDTASNASERELHEHSAHPEFGFYQGLLRVAQGFYQGSVHVFRAQAAAVQSIAMLIYGLGSRVCPHPSYLQPSKLEALPKAAQMFAALQDLAEARGVAGQQGLINTRMCAGVVTTPACMCVYIYILYV